MQLNYQYPDDIVRGVTKYLIGLPDVAGLVGQFPNGTPFIFEEEIGVAMQGVSKNWVGNPVTAVVVRSSNTWAAPDPMSSEQYPKVAIEIWADPPRDETGAVTRARDARTAADWLYQVIDNYLNRKTTGVVMMGSVTTWGSLRLAGISYLPSVPSDDHVLLGTAYYGLQMAAFFS